jgi:hypothetical protein
MVVDRQDQLSIILAMHIFAFIVLASLLIYFLHYEYGKFGKNWRRVFQNNFIRVTLLGDFAVLLNSIVYIVRFCTHFGFAAQELTTEQDSILIFLCSVIVLLGCLAHVCLLYLRTKGLFERNKRLLKFMQTMALCFVICSSLAMICGIGSLIPSSATDILSFLYTMFSGLYAISMCLMDFVTSIRFAIYVKKYGKGLKAQAFAERTTKSTGIVARFGILISPIALLSTGMFIFERSLTDDVTQEWISVFVIWGLYSVASLWTIMKIKLDNNNSESEGDTPKVKMTQAGFQGERPNPRSPNGSLSHPLMEATNGSFPKIADYDDLEKTTGSGTALKNQSVL